MLAGNQSKPCRELAAFTKRFTVANSRDQSGRCKRSDAWDSVQALAGFALLRGPLNQRLGLFDVACQLFQFLLQFDKQEAECS